MGLQSLEKLLKAAKSDAERWALILANKEHITLQLDNDDTLITVNGCDGYTRFADYIGDAPGVSVLLDAIGVKSEGV